MGNDQIWIDWALLFLTIPDAYKILDGNLAIIGENFNTSLISSEETPTDIITQSTVDVSQVPIIGNYLQKFGSAFQLNLPIIAIWGALLIIVIILELTKRMNR